jgi:hypothetical protein
MAEWLIELEGYTSDLDELVDQFESPQLNVKKEGDRYYLKSPREFGAFTDASSVRARASELLFLLSGIANLYLGDRVSSAPDAVIRVNDDGTRDRFEREPPRVPVRGKARLWGTKATNPTIGESWLSLARQDENVIDALHFFQEDASWWSLRKVYGVIESDLKGQQSMVAKTLATPEKEIKRFKEWASHYVHGERGKLPHRDHYPPLSLVEADRFLRALLKSWLRWKRGQQEERSTPL